MFKKTVALLMTTGLMAGLGACCDKEKNNNDLINNQKADLVGRGFKNPILRKGANYDFYSVSIGKCSVNLVWSSYNNAWFYYPSSGDGIRDPSAASLLAKNIPDLNGC